jgi:DNA-binding transcriptional ArsR family regulator
MTDQVTIDTEPLSERLISDVETLRALSDPVRLRILEVMTAAPDETFTVKRLATELATSQTKLYHHVNTLVERELVRVASQRVVSGIIETSYRVGQRDLRLDRALLSADSSVMHDTLATFFDSARDDIERGLRAGVITTEEDAAPEHKLFLARGLGRLDAAQAADFRARLLELFEAFGATSGDGAVVSGPDAPPAYGLVLGMYTMVDPVSDGSTEDPE